MNPFPDPPNSTLVGDLIAWLATEPRRYEDAMAAWRTSCPRLTIWEDATDLGLVERFCDDGIEMVRATSAGAVWLETKRPELGGGAS